MTSLVILFALLTLITLITGLVFMARGGNVNKQYSNKLMTLRVILQGCTIALLGLLLVMS